MSTTEGYRWDQTQAAVDYDAAAPVIHPCYVEVQDAVLAALAEQAFASRTFRVVDLGGGSGRLIERVLEAFPRETGMVVDQSEPFLAVAQQRLARFGNRATFAKHRLQDDWRGSVGSVDAVVSTSAIHHLEAAEKQQLFAQVFSTLPAGGMFINGDEQRPASDDAYRAMLETWRDHMESSLSAGEIPATFEQVIEVWRKRNLDEFGAPHKSGNDCLETIETQMGYLRAAGFSDVSVPWQRALWAAFVAVKA